MTENGLSFLISKERYHKKAHLDNKGVWAVGYGSIFWESGTPVKDGDSVISEKFALDLLKNTISIYENMVEKDVLFDNYSKLNDNQKDALTSFLYSYGDTNFMGSDVCTIIRSGDVNNKAKIKDAFMEPKNCLVLKKNKWVKDKDMTKRRSEEASMYFGEKTNVKKVDTNGTSTTSTNSGIVTQETYNSSYGINNMFYELSHSPDWVVTPFKKYPRKSNNWSSLSSGSSCPQVGDLLFAYHDGLTSGQHHHVGIYMGMHDGQNYIAEGNSRYGTNIHEESGRGVQISPIATSRLSLDTDIITHFAHCKKTEIPQTAGLINKEGNSSFNNANYTYITVVGEENMKHFKIIDLTRSEQAKNNNIDNVPTQEARKNLVNLTNYLLDPLYDAVKDIGILFVTSGYRNEELNRIVGGSSISQHKSGQAVDLGIKCKGSKGDALLKVAKILLENEDIGYSYDQMILENVNSGLLLRPEWLHISFVSKEKNRTYNDTTKLMYSTGNGKYISVTRDYVLSREV